jgi:hypothetical protein
MCASFGLPGMGGNECGCRRKADIALSPLHDERRDGKSTMPAPRLGLASSLPSLRSICSIRVPDTVAHYADRAAVPRVQRFETSRTKEAARQ